MLLYEDLVELELLLYEVLLVDVPVAVLLLTVADDDGLRWLETAEPLVVVLTVVLLGELTGVLLTELLLAVPDFTEVLTGVAVTRVAVVLPLVAVDPDTALLAVWVVLVLLTELLLAMPPLVETLLVKMRSDPV